MSDDSSAGVARNERGSVAGDASASVDGGEGHGTLERLRRRRNPIREAVWLVRKELVVSFGLFAVFALLGYVVVGPLLVERNPEVFASVATDCRSADGGLFRGTTLEYFLNNGGVAGVMLGGMGVLTVPVVAYNGLLMGSGWAALVGTGTPPLVVAACLAPHSLFELPALWLAGAVGLFLPRRLVASLLGRREEIVDPTEELDVVQLVALVLVLLLLAGFVEANLSSAFARAAFGTP